MIDITSDEKTKFKLEAKNERRRNAIPDMKREMKEESNFQKRQ